MAIKFNDTEKNENAQFAEYDESCYIKEREALLDMLIEWAMEYRNQTDRYNELTDKILDTIYDLYEERAAAIRIVLKMNDAAFKKEYKKLIDETK